MKSRIENSGFSNRNLLIVLVLALALVIALGTILARRLLIFSPDDLVFQGDNAYALDTSIEDSLAVFANDATLDADVDGHVFVGAVENIELNGGVGDSVTAFAEDIVLNGDIDGDALFAGVNVEINGEINGDTVVFAERVQVNTTLTGTLTACATEIEWTPGTTVLPCDRSAARTLLNRAGSRLAGVWLAARLNGPPRLSDIRPMMPLPPGLLMAALGALIVVAIPRHIDRMTLAVRTHPWRMALIGALVTLLLIGLTAAMLMALSLVSIAGMMLLPIYLLVAMAFWLMFTGGWVVTSLLVGRWIVRKITDAMIPPVVSVAVGGMVLSMGALVLNLLPRGDIITPIGMFIAGLCGLGASYTTRLGMRRVEI